jgi:hypothetical protein
MTSIENELEKEAILCDWGRSGAENQAMETPGSRPSRWV